MKEAIIDMQKLVYKAYYVSNNIDLKNYRLLHTEGLISFNSSLLYYQRTEVKFVYMASYGVVVFSNFEENEIQQFLGELKEYCDNWVDQINEENLEVRLEEEGSIKITFDDISVDRFDHDVNKTIMLNLAQSVTLDYYDILTQQLLGTIRSYTRYMRDKGKINLGQKDTLKFIGETLVTKNNIAQHLYILDIPEIVWEDEYLDRLHKGLITHFDLNQRYRAIGSTLKIIEDNLTVFISYNHHRESSRLEWIIIILIVIEVLDTFISKLF